MENDSKLMRIVPSYCRQSEKAIKFLNKWEDFVIDLGFYNSKE